MNPATDLIPEDIRDRPLMVIAWRDCLLWAIDEPEVFKAFQTETGIAWKPPTSPILAMIDDVTGYTDHCMVNFIKWFNANIWGTIE